MRSAAQPCARIVNSSNLHSCQRSDSPSPPALSSPTSPADSSSIQPPSRRSTPRRSRSCWSRRSAAAAGPRRVVSTTSECVSREASRGCGVSAWDPAVLSVSARQVAIARNREYTLTRSHSASVSGTEGPADEEGSLGCRATGSTCTSPHVAAAVSTAGEGVCGQPRPAPLASADASAPPVRTHAGACAEVSLSLISVTLSGCQRRVAPACECIGHCSRRLVAPPTRLLFASTSTSTA
eukprot:scaffold293861_cov28-Tisochrysis_lutea.AAC.2